MLRVGLTGGLGSGKSTAARMFAERGAVVLSSDEIGRELTEPGQSVYAAIVGRFGHDVVSADGRLDRAALARLAFEQGVSGPSALEELNAIVHPAVIARQDELIAAFPEDAIVVIESALIFETKHGSKDGDSWRRRFDRLILVTAPEQVKVERFLRRSGATMESSAALEAEARRRLAVQMPDEAKAHLCDYVVSNDADLVALGGKVDVVWQELKGQKIRPE